MANGKLAAYDLIGGVTQSIYQNNTDKYSVVSLSLCNRGTAATSLTVGVGDTESVINNFDIFEYEIGLLPKNVLVRTGIVIPSGKYLTVLSTNSNISAVATGVVTGDEINTVPILTQTDTVTPLWVTPTSFDWPSNETLVADHPGDPTYTVTAGALPDGLSLNSTSGLISGTPTTLGVATTPTIVATSPSGQTASRSFTITPIATTPPLKVAAAAGSSNDAPAAPLPLIGEARFVTPGTYSWVAPAGITSVSTVVVGGGGAGCSSHDSNGGAGGSLGWKNSIAVTPGETYTVVVGAGGAARPIGAGVGTAGGQSYFISTGTVQANGGNPGPANNAGPVTNSGGFVGDGGGGGGYGQSSRGGGGGAGGYTGTGGFANYATTPTAPASGSGAGSGGISINDVHGPAGGGTGIFGLGVTARNPSWTTSWNNGAWSYSLSNAQNMMNDLGGKGGSGGGDPIIIQNGGGNYPFSTDGGFPGGGGGGGYNNNGPKGGNGGNGAVRIIWGDSRTFPSTNVDEASSNDNIYIDNVLQGGGGPAPSGSSLDITLVGGGSGGSQAAGLGGSGGYGLVTITVPDSQIRVVVGSGGIRGGGSGWTNFGGAGRRYVTNDQGSSGGGYSGVFKTDGTPIVLVGGAGGSDWQDQGGNGGGINQNGGAGYDGQSGSASQQGAIGQPGTTTAGGAGGTGYAGCTGETGSSLQGGASTCSDTYSGGGGGGGYYGGGAGTGNTGAGGTPGGGGSGYLNPAYTATVATTTATQNRSTSTWQTSTYHQSGMPTNLGGGGGYQANGQNGYVKIIKDGSTIFESSTPQSTVISI